MEAQIIMSITQLIIKYGIPGALKILKAWDVDNPTIEDIEALPDLKPPDSYFEKENP